ncbi:uncharacterized protein ATC70_003352 [Mucor velutinosus]|uniref:Uncharacterized protein n=1 Tax=Mucor velutinosus TaxID=708070 RepID=A0AAN7HXZ0_9FUNG|nr:hypothetical protein ATC70_003352 [Mucor velutinosus]
MKLFLCSIVCLVFILNQVNALPVQHAFVPSSLSHESPIDAQEYTVYSSVVEYYENLVDTTLSSESEELLINLIHLPKESMKNILTLQAESMGFKTISDKQLNKMPSLIGKHIQAMNTHVYESIEPIVKNHWPTVWDKKLLYADDQEEILSFLSSLNGIVAKKLMDQVDNYSLLEKIKQDMVALYEREQERSWFHWLSSTKKIVLSFEDTVAEEDANFLRQHATDIRTSLLMELHIQFMDFFTRIQSDIIEQLVIYED